MSMPQTTTTYTGVVKNGEIVLNEPVNVPDGTVARIIVTPGDLITDKLVENEETRCEPDPELKLPTLAERFKDVIGKATDLPSDFAENHDHYIHGAPKKK